MMYWVCLENAMLIFVSGCIGHFSELPHSLSLPYTFFPSSLFDISRLHNQLFLFCGRVKNWPLYCITSPSLPISVFLYCVWVFVCVYFYIVHVYFYIKYVFLYSVLVSVFCVGFCICVFYIRVFDTYVCVCEWSRVIQYVLCIPKMKSNSIYMIKMKNAKMLTFPFENSLQKMVGETTIMLIWMSLKKDLEKHVTVRHTTDNLFTPPDLVK